MKSNEWKVISFGLIFILLSIIIELGILPISDNNNEFPTILEWALTIISKVCSSIGLALLVGCITSKLNRKDNIIQEMNENDKKDILKKIMHRNNELDKYKDFAMEKLYNLEDKYFADYRIEGVIECSKGHVLGTMLEDYYEYGRNMSDNRISLYFDNPNDKVQKIIIYDPNDLRKYEEFTNITNQINNGAGGTYEYEWYVEIPERFRALKSLKIHREYTAYGQDHWIQVGHAFSRPTKGVSINMQYGRNLTVKECSVIDTNNVFVININDTLRNYSVDTHKWVSEGNGMSLLVSTLDEATKQ